MNKLVLVAVSAMFLFSCEQKAKPALTPGQEQVEKVKREERAREEAAKNGNGVTPSVNRTATPTDRLVTPAERVTPNTERLAPTSDRLSPAADRVVPTTPATPAPGTTSAPTNSAPKPL